MEIREEAEAHIKWELNNGSSSFWWDNWIGQGPLARIAHNGEINMQKVRDFTQHNAWDHNKLTEAFPAEWVERITNISVPTKQVSDHPIWTITNAGNFSCRSAWENLKQVRSSTFTASRIWNKTLPFKVSFFMMRLLNRRLPTDDAIKKFGFMGLSNCHCCKTPKPEYIEHIFFQGEQPTRIWDTSTRLLD